MPHPESTSDGSSPATCKSTIALYAHVWHTLSIYKLDFKTQAGVYRLNIYITQDLGHFFDNVYEKKGGQVTI